MAKHQTENYKTKDLGEAAALITKGEQFITLERTGKIYWFIFADKKACEQISTRYFFGELMVNAHQFHEIMSKLKGRIFAQSRD